VGGIFNDPLLYSQKGFAFNKWIITLTLIQDISISPTSFPLPFLPFSSMLFEFLYPVLTSNPLPNKNDLGCLQFNFFLGVLPAGDKN